MMIVAHVTFCIIIFFLQEYYGFVMFFSLLFLFVPFFTLINNKLENESQKF